MQFIPNGPEIPNDLLQSHEDGRVVFFCGAGISYPAGLPGFSGLVKKILDGIGDVLTPVEQTLFETGQYDSTLEQLERRVPNGRLAVRRKVINALMPDFQRAGATETHSALLKLARSSEGAMRLVTTNFDLIFEHVIERDKAGVHSYVAPFLPVPKDSRWDGLVYLHGRLPEKEGENALQHLVLTSGDFGLAYLVERWAARFVSELFRNYIVCFVGYSINDPILRYMMDALAADRRMGESVTPAYAFAEFESGKENQTHAEWESKGVTPIIYEIKPIAIEPKTFDHSTLHRTLIEWAKIYHLGISGKEGVVLEYAQTKPSESTKEDDFVGRMLWALEDKSGKPAKRFAELDPVPSLDWLEVFDRKTFNHLDLSRFGIQVQFTPSEKFEFGLLNRPSSFPRSPWMSLVGRSEVFCGWDSTMAWLAHWLVRHLNDPKLLIWLSKSGGRLHRSFAEIIEQKLNGLARLENQDEQNIAKLDETCRNAPNAVPDAEMRKYWRLLLGGRVASDWHGNDWGDFDFYRWEDAFYREGLTIPLRFRLRELLAPRITFQTPFSFQWGPQDEVDSNRTKERIRCELTLATGHIRSIIVDLYKSAMWKEALPKLLGEFQSLLIDALDLMAEVGMADEEGDHFYFDMPSIFPHWQNHALYDRSVLIELLRDAWSETYLSNPQKATKIAMEWFDIPYLTFKRLAFFTASHDNSISPVRWAEWLVSDHGRWLWSGFAKREVLRLLALQGKVLEGDVKKELESIILLGPPREHYDADEEEWHFRVERETWLRLAKLKSSDMSLDVHAEHRFAELSQKHPSWNFSKHEREEFSSWMSGTGSPDYEDNLRIDVAPTERKELVEWIKRTQQIKKDTFYDGDTWHGTCTEHAEVARLALCDLSREGLWPKDRWETALFIWSDEKFVKDSWRALAPFILDMPDNVLQLLAHAISYWIEKATYSIDCHDEIFMEPCCRLLALPYDENEDADFDISLANAINHPVGLITGALLNFWFRSEPNDNDLMPADIKELLTRVCDPTQKRFVSGRVILASRIISLFRVDKCWTEQHLLHFFDWSSSREAASVWSGFFWSPRLYWPLMESLKEPFFDSVRQISGLGGNGSRYATFFTLVALADAGHFPSSDYQSAITHFSPEEIEVVARTLVQSLEASQNKEEYWESRIQPFWQNIWPKSTQFMTVQISERLAELSIASGNKFPEAVSTVKDWLMPGRHTLCLADLQKSGLCRTFPNDSLSLMDAVVDKNSYRAYRLEDCLREIEESNPTIISDVRFKSLHKLIED